MTISSVASVAPGLIASSTASTSGSGNAADIQKQEQVVQQDITKEQQSKDDAQTKAQKLQEYNQELKKFEAELDELSKPSSASTAAAKPKGPTSELVDESA